MMLELLFGIIAIIIWVSCMAMGLILLFWPLIKVLIIIWLVIKAIWWLLS